MGSNILENQMGPVKRIWYLSPMRVAKVQASLRIRAVSPEPPLLAHTSSESRGTFRQKARSLPPLSLANLPIICYLQSTVTSKFTEYLLLTVDCHQQIYRIIAIDSRLSPANLPNICYWQSTITSHSVFVYFPVWVYVFLATQRTWYLLKWEKNKKIPALKTKGSTP